jgi:hypothetical protein
MTRRSTKVLSAGALVFAVFVTSSANAQQSSQPIKAVQILGLAGVKDNAKGVLSVENGQLRHALFCSRDCCSHPAGR